LQKAAVIVFRDVCEERRTGAMMFAKGDTHADFRRFSKSIFFEQDKLTKNDYVIVCGDFGIWDKSSREKY
jgi:hypothetical protein